MTDEPTPPDPIPERLPLPDPDVMLQAAASWLDSANLSDADRELITAQTGDMAAKLSVFCHALASSRATSVTKTHVFMEHVKDLLVSPTNMAQIQGNPHALMELMKVLQKSMDSETKYLTDMTSPDRIQALQDARMKTGKKVSHEGKDSLAKDQISQLPSHKREKVRALLDSILGSDKLEGD